MSCRWWLIACTQAGQAMAQTQGGEEVQQLVEELEREVRRLQGVVGEGTTTAGYLAEVNREILFSS